MGLLDAPVPVVQIRENGRGVQRASKALFSLTTSQAPPLVGSPTITLTSSVDGATPTQWKANTSGSATFAPNPGFAFSGFAYQATSAVNPENQSVTAVPLPTNPSGTGRAIAEFISDAPAISLPFYRAQLGQGRVFVDGYEVLRFGNASRAATAQAGTSTTITLDSGASAVNGFYFGQWVHITGGTGAGQYAQITAYVGSTKVATVAPTWPTVPDSTSTFELTATRMAYTVQTQAGYTFYYFKLDWNGERRMRRYRVECDGFGFYGCYTTSAIDSVLPCAGLSGAPAFWCGDSFSFGTGSSMNTMTSLARIACDALGWECHNLSIGGTGYLNPGVNGLVLTTRLLPPTNAWFVDIRGASAGSFTLTQSGTTVTINWNDSVATTQANMDSHFGAGAFLVAGDGGRLWFIGQGGNAASAAAMTANWSGLTAGVQRVTQYLGDLAPQVPKDGNGNILPFTIVLADGHNDTTDTNGAYTASLLQSTVTSLIAALVAAYPQATIWIVGSMFLPGGGGDAAITAANGALAAAAATAPKVNGRVAFIDTISAPAWMTGTGYAGNLKGDGNSDVTCSNDGVHPSPAGHRLYGTRIAQAILAILGA